MQFSTSAPSNPQSGGLRLFSPTAKEPISILLVILPPSSSNDRKAVWYVRHSSTALAGMQALYAVLPPLVGSSSLPVCRRAQNSITCRFLPNPRLPVISQLQPPYLSSLAAVWLALLTPPQPGSLKPELPQ